MKNNNKKQSPLLKSSKNNNSKCLFNSNQTYLTNRNKN